MKASLVQAIILTGIALLSTVPFLLHLKRIPFGEYSSGGWQQPTMDNNAPHAVASRRLATAAPMSTLKIPRVIVQTHRGEYVSRGMWEAMQSVIRANPDFDYEYYSDARAQDFITRYFDKKTVAAYTSMPATESKSVFFSLCFLFVKGGVFVDPWLTATVAAAASSLSDVINPSEELVATTFRAASQVFCSGLVFASIPRHPVVEMALRRFLEQQSNNPSSPLGLLAIVDRMLFDAAEQTNSQLQLIVRDSNEMHKRDGTAAVDIVSSGGHRVFSMEVPMHVAAAWGATSTVTAATTGIMGALNLQPLRVTRSCRTCPPCLSLTQRPMSQQRTDDNMPRMKAVLPIAAFRRARTPATSKILRIPMVVVQIHDHDEVRPATWRNAQRLRWLNPEFAFVYFSVDRARREFILRHFDERILTAYDALSFGPSKKFLLGLFYLFVNGGVFVDTDLVANAALINSIVENEELVVVLGQGLRSLSSTFLAAIAGHPVLGMAIDRTVDNILHPVARYELHTPSEFLFNAYREFIIGRGIAYGEIGQWIIQRPNNCEMDVVSSSADHHVFFTAPHAYIFARKPRNGAKERRWVGERHSSAAAAAVTTVVEEAGVCNERLPPKVPLLASIRDKIMLPAVKASSATPTNSTFGIIPKSFVHLAPFHYVPRHIKVKLQRMIEANPGFDHRVYTNAEAYRFISKNCGRDAGAAFNSSSSSFNHQYQREAVFCLCYLQTLGGVCHLHRRSRCVIAASSVFNERSADEFVAGFDSSMGDVIVAAAADHPIVHRALSTLIADGNLSSCVDLSGCVAHALREAFNETVAVWSSLTGNGTTKAKGARLEERSMSGEYCSCRPSSDGCSSGAPIMDDRVLSRRSTLLPIGLQRGFVMTHWQTNQQLDTVDTDSPDIAASGAAYSEVHVGNSLILLKENLKNLTLEDIERDRTSSVQKVTLMSDASTSLLTPAPLTCLGWRQTGGCSVDGPREPKSDRTCDEEVFDGSSGFCDCYNKTLGEFVPFKVACRHPPFRCRRVCAQGAKLQHFSRAGKIPRVIVQTHRGEYVPRGMWEAMQSVIRANPDFDYEYYSDTRARSFIAEHCGDATLKAFDRVIPGAMKAGLFRLCYLQRRGGVYLDVSVFSAAGYPSFLSNMINGSVDFVGACEHSGRGGIVTSFIAAAPNHAILHRAISIAIDRIMSSNYGIDVEDVVGRIILWDAFVDVTGALPLPKSGVGAASRREFVLPITTVDSLRARLDRYWASRPHLARRLLWKWGESSDKEQSATEKPLHVDVSYRVFTFEASSDSVIGRVIDTDGKPLLWSSFLSYERLADMYNRDRVPAADAWYQHRVFDEEKAAIVRPMCPFGVVHLNTQIDYMLIPSVVLHAVRRFTAARLPPSRPLRVPRTILQTNKFSAVPKGMHWAMQKIIDLNPEFDYLYFPDDEAREFIASFFDAKTLLAFDALTPGAFKADLFRYCYLSVYGGVYIDGDLNAIRPVLSVLRETDEFVSVEDNGEGRIYNAFLAVAPHHPIIERAIEMCVDGISQRNYTNSDLGITGPVLLQRAFVSVVGKPPRSHATLAPGVRLLSHTRDWRCFFGFIEGAPKQILFWTPYLNYQGEMKAYRGKPQKYAELWNQRAVFSPPEAPHFSFRLHTDKMFANESFRDNDDAET